MTTAEIEQKINAATVEITKIFDNIEINCERIAKISGEDLTPEISAARELCAMIGRISIVDRNGFCRVRVARAVGAAFALLSFDATETVLESRDREHRVERSLLAKNYLRVGRECEKLAKGFEKLAKKGMESEKC